MAGPRLGRTCWWVLVVVVKMVMNSGENDSENKGERYLFFLRGCLEKLEDEEGISNANSKYETRLRRPDDVNITT